MASTLDGGGKDRNVTRGHGTSALGPSDSSDTGSDITGGPGLVEGDVIGLDESGTTSDAETGRSAGQSIGDADLDSDSDRNGTGERRAAGLDPASRADIDRDTDTVTDSPGGSSRDSRAGDDMERGAGPDRSNDVQDDPAGTGTGRGNTPV